MGKPPGPHTSELQCLGSPACGTPLGHSSGGGVTIRPPCSQTPLVLVALEFIFTNWSVAGSQLLPALILSCLCPGKCHGCRPHPPLPNTTSVTEAVLADNRGPPPALGALPGSLWAGPGGTLSFLLSAGRPAWFLGDLGPRETPSYTFTFCLEPSTVPFKVISCFLTRKNRVFFLAYCSQSSE